MTSLAAFLGSSGLTILSSMRPPAFTANGVVLVARGIASPNGLIDPRPVPPGLAGCAAGSVGGVVAEGVLATAAGLASGAAGTGFFSVVSALPAAPLNGTAIGGVVPRTME